jgi:predicted site-specific integrase-resolvase
MIIYLSETEEAQRLKVSKRTLQRWRKEGKGPPYHRAGVRVLYDPTATDQWPARTLQAGGV